MTAPTSTPPIPKDPKHQRFADAYIGGKTVTEAYLCAGYKVGRDIARKNGNRLLKREDVAAYIAAIQQASAEASVLELVEKRLYLARLVRTPITKINPKNPDDPNLDLLKKWKLKSRTEGRGDDAEEFWTEEIEKYDALKAIDLDNRLAGLDPTANSIEAFAAALAEFGSDTLALPNDKM